jgi:predicted outer membrane repeat protein
MRIIRHLARIPAFLQRTACFALFAGATCTAGAATIIVTTTSDNGAGSLRSALGSAANGDIVDGTAVSGTITLTSGVLVVSNNLVILGPGPANLAISGNAASGVFSIGPGKIVTLRSLTITNGFSQVNYNGGGIYNDHSTLSLSNCSVTGNLAGDFSAGAGIYNDGGSGTATVMIVNSTVSDNLSAGDPGGGIYNNGFSGSATLTIINSTFSGNFAEKGGAIYNDGSSGSAVVTISNSTISGNSVSLEPGGGIYNNGFLGIAMLAIINSTVSGNTATNGGGIYSSGNASLLIANTTFSDNSAMSHAGTDIYNDASAGNATLAIGSTILNSGGSGATIFNNSGTIASLGYNLSNDGGGGFLTATGDQTYTDPMLGSLQTNGGPTRTHALMPGSPAIGQGKSFGATTDQRGLPRPVIDLCITNAAGSDGSDIGAFETQETCQPVDFKITDIRRDGNDLRLSYTTVLNSNYVVQASSNLVNGSWTNLPVTNIGIGVVMQSIVTNALLGQQQLYRIRRLP